MELISTHVCMTKDVGVHGNLFGGVMLAWLDEAGAAYACQLCDNTTMVTKAITDVVFAMPVKPGHIVKIYGMPIRAGRTSATFKLEARRHSPHAGVQKVVCSTEMTFVHIDADGDAIPLTHKARKQIDTNEIIKGTK